MDMGMRLPEDVEIEICLRLPVKSVTRFKSVCKRWESLMSIRGFLSSYNHHECRRRDNRLFCYSKGPFNARVRLGIIEDHDDQAWQTERQSILSLLEFPPFYTDDSWAWEDVDDEDLIREFHEGNLCHTRRYDVHIMGPINGIYCIYQRLRYKHGGTLILWNPATRSYKYILPHISFPFPLHLQDDLTIDLGDERIGDPRSLHVGFGHDPPINDYTFVAIYRWVLVYIPIEEVLVRVYNSATNSWLTIYHDDTDDRSFPYINSEPRFCNSFINGRCHFSCAKRHPELEAYDVLLEYGVFAVDMARHTFKYMRGPPIPLDRNVIKKSFIPFDSDNIKTSVWVLRETIAMVAFYTKRRKIQVWIMRQYGVEDSWDLLCSIPIKGGFDLVGIPNDHRVLVGNRRGQLMSYDLDDFAADADNGVKTKPLGPYRGTLGVFNYVESLTPISPPQQ